MKASQYSAQCEKIVADAMRPVASELRLVDAADLIALLRFERHGELAELVAESAELFFMPGTVSLGIGGEYHLEWRGEPKIVLDLELKPKGVTVYLRLTLQDEKRRRRDRPHRFREPLRRSGGERRLPCGGPAAQRLRTAPTGSRRLSISLFFRNSGRKTASRFSWNCSRVAGHSVDRCQPRRRACGTE